eukprot:TRINITY_DN9645_c0_g2_i4.p1 TRINITY_DN9645_c0_g2~~TRINITY_DN9645_c0_g2_i4.p1  ORF type:complete len:413 (+),score=104.27 TRINITY_DN9645_c0_g2_i4:139-1377(+)
MDCLPKEQFISHEYLNQLTCSICLGIFNEPLELSCQHTFCKFCIKDWLKKNDTCPKCRNTVGKDSLKPNLVFSNMIKYSVVSCNNEKCSWKGPYATLRAHLTADCPEQECYCPFGCTVKHKRCDMETHTKNCELRIFECRYCHAKGQYREVAEHENRCELGMVDCPNSCGRQVALSALPVHLESSCKNRKIVCKFNNFIDCDFVGGDEEMLLGHYERNKVQHLERLAERVIELQKKIDSMYQSEGPAYAPETTPKSNGIPIDVYWSNNSKKAAGTTVNYWSFYLSSMSISKPFKARIKVNSVNTSDANGWKICLGVFNTSVFTVGSWSNYKNGWGYILGNGNKVFTHAVDYGASYGVGDVISIVWDGKDLEFCKNTEAQGKAFTDITGPLYLAVALSDAGHSVELLSVETYN